MRGADAPELLLIVDCVYHLAPVLPLRTALTSLATPQHTGVVVVVELGWARQRRYTGVLGGVDCAGLAGVEHW